MYRKELDNILRSGQRVPAVMLYGDSHFLIDYYIKIFSNIEGANVLSLYHDEYDFNAAKAHLSQGSLLEMKTYSSSKMRKKSLKESLTPFWP